MKVLLMVGALTVFVLLVEAQAQSGERCSTSSAKAFVSIRPDPPYLVGTIPSRFSSNPVYFSRRFNCRGSSAFVRRVDLGVYDVRFPGMNVVTTVATATSDEGIAASAQPLGDGIVRITLRGPLVVGEVIGRRDVPFSVVVY